MNSLKSKLAIDGGERAKTTPNIPMDIAHQLNCKNLIASIVQNISLIGHFHATFRIRVLAI